MHLIKLVALAAVWGASFLFMSIAAPEFGVVALISVRLATAAIVLIPFWWFAKRREPYAVLRQHAVPLVAVGLLNSAIPFVLFAYSVLFVTGGVAAVLNSTVPIWSACVAWIWLRARPSSITTIGLMLGFLGVVILVWGESGTPSVGQSSSNKLWGLAAAASAPILYAIAANISSEKLSALSPLTITTFSLAVAALALVPLSFWNMPQTPPSSLAWYCAIALGLICTALAYIWYFQLIAEIGSTRAITVTFMVPIFGSLWGGIFLNEAITISMLIGAGVILSGTAMVVGLVKSNR